MYIWTGYPMQWYLIYFELLCRKHISTLCVHTLLAGSHQGQHEKRLLDDLFRRYNKLMCDDVVACRQSPGAAREATAGRPLPSLQQARAAGLQRHRLAARVVRADAAADHRRGTCLRLRMRSNVPAVLVSQLMLQIELSSCMCMYVHVHVHVHVHACICTCTWLYMYEFTKLSCKDVRIQNMYPIGKWSNCLRWQYLLNIIIHECGLILNAVLCILCVKETER